MKKFILICLCLFIGLIPSFADTSGQAYDSDAVEFFNFCYKYVAENDSYKFCPLPNDDYKALPKEIKKAYKIIKKADKMWDKGLKYPNNDERRYKYFEEAFNLNPTLFPVASSLSYYYFGKNNYEKGIYYIKKIPVNFDDMKYLKLSLMYGCSGMYNDAIVAANEFLKQENISEKNAIIANNIIMNAYFSCNKYDEALKYADILIDKYNSCHDYQLRAWNTRYYCYLFTKDYKNALNTAIQMAKIWGYIEHFEKIKLCTDDIETRINSYNIVRKDHLRRGNDDRVRYIDSLIIAEKEGFWDDLEKDVQTREQIKTESVTPRLTLETKTTMYRIGEACGTISRVGGTIFKGCLKIINNRVIQGIFAGGVAGILTRDALYGLGVGYKYINRSLLIEE